MYYVLCDVEQKLRVNKTSFMHFFTVSCYILYSSGIGKQYYYNQLPLVCKTSFEPGFDVMNTQRIRFIILIMCILFFNLTFWGALYSNFVKSLLYSRKLLKNWTFDQKICILIKIFFPVYVRFHVYFPHLSIK